jgi:hypothetical protein
LSKKSYWLTRSYDCDYFIAGKKTKVPKVYFMKQHFIKEQGDIIKDRVNKGGDK